ncbi:glycosyltransferase family A protein [Methanorbis furvi]|uniref:Glycosyltransferase 2-like domain-containing protein n=1 Tax=Methanorbis furvi TaxID=3028299 RepID=A0AAE4S9K9_9EURY|nr:hypothetical protein [Methanocorpusculaceae archaeon Ag1]
MSTVSAESKSLVSIIIPIYNGINYIETTLNDLFAQTYQNFEIIIAYDEKSTDNTLALLQKISKNHPINIDIGNDSSTGAARNRGISLAKGEYIVFVDSDDRILPDYLESMLTVFEAHPELDVVCCGTLFIHDTKIPYGLQKAKNSPTEIILYQKDDAIMLKIFDILPWGIWAHMIRRAFLIDNNLKLPDCTVREDLVFTLNLFMHAEKIGYSTKIVYLYLKHAESLTTSKFDKWWKESQISRNELAKLSQNLPQNAAKEILYRDQRLVAAGSACSYDYKTYLTVLHQYDVSHLSFYRGGDSISGKMSVIVFNISKYLYYRSIRYMKKI